MKFSKYERDDIRRRMASLAAGQECLVSQRSMGQLLKELDLADKLLEAILKLDSDGAFSLAHEPEFRALGRAVKAFQVAK